MSTTMTWKAVVTFCAVTAVGLWGCGGGGGGGTTTSRVIPEGYSEVTVTAGGVTGAAVSHEIASLDIGLFKDASDTGTGTASSAGGPTSIYDSVTVVCTMTAGAATNVEATQIATLQANCINDNECIVCTAAGSASDACSITCNGVVPSNAAHAADTFDVIVEFTSTVATDMPDPYGTLRYDASRSAAGFDLSALSSSDFTGCTYDAGVAYELSLTPIAPGTWFTSTASQYRSASVVTAVDRQAGNSNRTDCDTMHGFTASASLAGAATPGTTVTNNLGVVTFKTKICDYEDASPSGTSFHDETICVEP